MEEQQRNWDPSVKRFFLKILRSFSWGLIWMMAGVMLGLYYRLGFFNRKPVIYTILFYAGMLITLVLLIRYLIKLWKEDSE
jgi:hypothetical protein